MDTAVINIKTEAKVKFSAQKLAKEMGLSLSALINSLLKQVIRSKKIVLNLRSEEEPSEMLLTAMKEAEEDIKTGKTISFENNKAMFKYLDKIIEHDKESGKS